MERDEDRKRSNSASSGDDGTDEFGRNLSTKKTKNAKEEDEWPPCFQDSSEDFVLDSRSGMFYEANSDFFYDPTSKLYYSNKKRAYFSYDADKKTFIPVESSGEMSADNNNSAESKAADQHDHFMLVPNGANSSAEPRKQGIAIKLATVIPKQKSEKKRKKRSDSSADPNMGNTKVTRKSHVSTLSEPSTKVQKQNVANIEKWSERAGGEAPLAAKNAKLTSKGKPICWVCKRKFPTLEKLQQHEEKSDLHKENLAKQEQTMQKQSAEAGKPKITDDNGPYVDRAKQRRNMYGPELVIPSVAAGIPAGAPEESQDYQHQPADSSVNIGHQMLQKLGWESGAALGRGSEQQKQQQAALAQDWDRIENLAAKNPSSGSYRRRS